MLDGEEVASESSADNMDMDIRGDSENVAHSRDDTKLWVISQQGSSSGHSREYNVAYDLQSREISKERTIHPAEDASGRVRDPSSINEKLSESLARINLPKCHPDVYNGNVTMFHPWRSSFQGMIRDCHLSPEQEMNYLTIVYTSGEPQKLVNSFRRHPLIPVNF